MGKWSKIISFVLVLILSVLFLKNIFTKPENEVTSLVNYSRFHALKTAPVALTPKKDTYVSKSQNDNAYKYTKLWNLPEIYANYSKDCLDNYLNFHPTIAAKRDNLFEYYGIKIGTAAWDELVAAYEKQATEVCSSFSGLEIEELHASIFRDSFTDLELQQLLNFYKTELGQKVIVVSNKANETLQEHLSRKQAEVLKKEALHFNKETERLYLKFLEEDGGWFERNWYKMFSK